MTCFEMVKYHSLRYPEDIPLRIEEVAANMDTQAVYGNMDFSLHTEYSFGKRNMDHFPAKHYQVLVDARKDGIPQLWKSKEWSESFALFLFNLMEGKKQPKVIEIHPPFNDYTDMPGFIETYKTFEALISEKWPNTDIFIENRYGSLYRGGQFVLSRTKDILTLRDLADKNGLKLKLAYDIPQIYSAHRVTNKIDYLRILNKATDFRDFIGGVHLWGKAESETGRTIAHNGDFNTFFHQDTEIKNRFLNGIRYVFNDGNPRKLVLEVNSGSGDANSIIKDLRSVEIQFV